MIGASASFAYDPDAVHAELARVAVRAFNECVEIDPQAIGGSKHFRAITNSEAQLIVAADVGEDREHLWRRSWNWHFYSAADRPLWWFGIDRSLNRIFGDIQAALAAEAPAGVNEAQLIGRMMHFLEDMTVPAHVVPVYHGPWVPGHRASFPTQKDKIDVYAVSGVQERIGPHIVEICEQLRVEDEKTPRQLLDDNAVDTMRRIDEPICKQPEGSPTWHVFWDPPAEGEMFGRYSTQVPAFGDIAPLRVGSCTVTRAAYDDFVHRGHDAAVLSDVRLLLRTRVNGVGTPDARP